MGVNLYKIGPINFMAGGGRAECDVVVECVLCGMHFTIKKCTST